MQDEVACIYALNNMVLTAHIAQLSSRASWNMGGKQVAGIRKGE
jgi:hypothetical protein